MREIALLAALAALSACSQEAEKPAPPAAAEEAAAPTMADTAGVYDYTLDDGTTGVTVLAADGAYTDTEGDGESVEKGTWSLTNGKTCFDPQGDDAANPDRCFTIGEPDAQGVQLATGEDGTVVKVRKHPAA